MRAKAAVIGGGVVGHACALALQRAGLAVTLFDPMREPAGASWGNAGHIATEQVVPLASRATMLGAPRRLFAFGGALDFRARDIGAWLPFALRFAAATARFASGKAALTALLAEVPGAWRRLAASLGDPGLYVENGHYIMWETPASAAAGLARWQATDIGQARLRPASAGEIARLATLTRRPPAGAIRFSGTGQISDPTRLANLLAQAFATGGGARRFDRVQAIAMANDKATIVLDGGETIAPDVVVLAAGARSAGLLRGAGLRAPLIAERGYHIQAPAGAWPRDLSPVVFEDRSMIVTRFASTVRAASFLEFARPDTPPDPRKWERLRDHVRALGLPFALTGTPWMGSRPTLPDYLPAIGHSGRNLLYAFGHQHLGLTLSAVTGEIVAALATGAAPPVPLAPFDLARFGQASAATPAKGSSMLCDGWVNQRGPVSVMWK